jgi:hypothetical protein
LLHSVGNILNFFPARLISLSTPIFYSLFCKCLHHLVPQFIRSVMMPKRN